MKPEVKRKIEDLLTEKVKQIKYGAGAAYFEKWGIRRINRHDLPIIRRRSLTALMRIETGFYEIPMELIEKVLTLGSFPPHEQTDFPESSLT